MVVIELLRLRLDKGGLRGMCKIGLWTVSCWFGRRIWV